MTKRYYYTDPRAVLLMGKHFGMKFLSRHTDEQMDEYDLEESERFFDWLDGCSVNGFGDIETVSDAITFIEAVSGKIYVHPESEHLLNPHAGDKDQDGYIFGGMNCQWGHPNIRTWCGEHTYIHTRETSTITQRNGIPFMTPEVEHAES